MRLYRQVSKNGLIYTYCDYIAYVTNALAFKHFNAKNCSRSEFNN